MTLTVVIIGPNLLDQTKGDFHVHRFGCADTHKAQYRLHREDVNTPITVGSRAEVVECVYPASDFDYDPETESDAYADGINFYPCTEGLN